MSLHLRIIDPRRTFIAPLRSTHGENRSRLVWLAIQRQKNDSDWAALFSRALDLLMEELVMDDVLTEKPTVDHGVSFAAGAGRIMWKRHAFWTIIRLELSVYSRKKRRLIVAALLKAARHGF